MSEESGYRFNIVLYHNKKVVGYRIGEFPDVVYEKIQELIDEAQKHADKNGFVFNGGDEEDDEPRELSDDGLGTYADQNDEELATMEAQEEPVSAIAQ